MRLQDPRHSLMRYLCLTPLGFVIAFAIPQLSFAPTSLLALAAVILTSAGVASLCFSRTFETVKSEWLGLFDSMALFGAIYFSVQFRMWPGLYINFDLARLILYLFGPGLFACLLLRRLLAIAVPRAFFISATLTVSLSVTLTLLMQRLLSTPVEISLGYRVWMIASTILIHALLGVSLLWRPRFLSGRIPIAARSVFALQFCILLFIAMFVDRNYPYADRAKGVFAVPAPHLRGSATPVRAVSSMSEAQQFRVLNYNLWVVEGWIPRFIATPSRDVDERLARLPLEIQKLNPDLVIFEEVWTAPRRAQIRQALEDVGYPFAVEGSDSPWSYMGIGNGLLIVSKHPLDQDIKAITYSVATRTDESAPFVRKGAIKTRVEISKDRWIDVYATHLGASDTVLKSGKPDEFDDAQLKVQLKQVNELTDFITQTRSSSTAIIGADLNTAPHVFRRGRYDAQLAPVYEEFLKLKFEDTGAALARDTYDTKTNHYARTGYFAYEPPGRIDYLFKSGPDLELVTTSLAVVETPLSDHYGVMTVFNVSRP